MRYICTFAIVTVMPSILLAIAALKGGFWVLPPLALLTAINQLIDHTFENLPDTPFEHKLKNALPVLLALFHFGLLLLAVWSLTQTAEPILFKIALFVSFSLYFATVSNANGHELIHRTSRFQFNLGKWIFISHLFGHHTSSHRLIHHPYVATKFDPNTARFNESFYRFFARAWRDSFLTGLSAENVKRGYDPDSRAVDFNNPYFSYILGASLFLAIFYSMAGIPGVLVYFALAFSAQAGLLLTDYVQHYGLSRQQGEDGRFTPVSLCHSWNAPHWYTRKQTLNAPYHSDHHAKPARPYTELQTYNADQAPQLPYGPGIMSLIALNPRHWRKLMNPRVIEVSNQFKSVS